MRTVFLYSGQARTIKWLHENHWFRVIRHFPNPTVVASVADDAQADDMRLLEQYVGKENFHFEKVVQPTIPEPPRTSPYHAGFPTISSPQAVLRQIWHWDRVWTFAMNVIKNEWSLNQEPVRCFVRIRPDSCFLANDFRINQIAPESAYFPWWSRWGGINDRFAVLGYNSAAKYHSLFANIKQMIKDGVPLHPESMLAEQFANRPHLNKIRTYFAPLRLPDEKHAGPWLDQLQISPIDMAEFAANVR